MPEAVIVATARTPIGRAFKGSLVGWRPDDLAAFAVQAAMDKVPQLDPALVDDLHLGCGLPGGEQGFNMGRVVSTLLGWDTVPGTTITRYCSSSLQTTRMAMHAIRAGEGDVFVSAGVEMVSRFMAPGRDGEPLGNSDPSGRGENPRFDAAMARTQAAAENGAEAWQEPDGLPDVYIPMGQTAENVALLEGITREEMDDFAFESQTRYQKAAAEGFWEREITPVTLPDGSTMTQDDSPRPPDREKMAELKPVFRPDGRITAGNACPLNDGAAAVVVMSDTRARELGITPLARVVSTGVSALNPEIMGLGPVESSRNALRLAGMTIDDIDLVEINEAFAPVVLAWLKDTDFTHEQTNVNGGAIALGHPLGATGAKLMTTLLHELERTGGRYGLQTMCEGGGQANVTIIERLS